MTQELIILLLFVVAAGYVGRMVYQSFFAKRAEKGCAKGCGSCSAMDVAKIEKQAHSSASASRPTPNR
jgi:hypothetical protein